ncbi:hypothetical protein BBJ28_00019670 [Nothophytophthora sp. Chile5]|nr:hypothetical protein BBJ28_00019670 [Nothophytophthora sp. Chile5]
MQLEGQTTTSREALIARQKQELVDVAPELARKAEAQPLAAVDQCLVTERELARRGGKLDHECRALQATLLAEKQQRKEQLIEHLAMKKMTQQTLDCMQQKQKEDAALAVVLAAQEQKQEASVAIEL